MLTQDIVDQSTLVAFARWLEAYRDPQGDLRLTSLKLLSGSIGPKGVKPLIHRARKHLQTPGIENAPEFVHALAGGHPDRPQTFESLRSYALKTLLTELQEFTDGNSTSVP